MFSKSNAWKLAALLLAVAVLAGCSAPTPTLAPTVDFAPTAAMIQTQSAQTVVADLTLNAPTVTPTVPPTETEIPATETPAATDTPVPPTPVPTNTFIPWTVTPAYTATSAYNCSITEVSPKSTDTLSANADFDGRWVVKNTGKDTWSAADTDIRYASGTKFQTHGDLFDLKSDVAANGSYTVIIDMKTPAKAGTYYASWVIVSGSKTLCSLGLSVQVK